MSWEPQSSMASLTTNHLWSCTTGRTWTSSVRECFAWCMISSSNLLRWLGWTEKMILFWQLMHCQELKQSLTLRWWVRSPPTPHPPAPLRFHTHWGFLVSIQQRSGFRGIPVWLHFTKLQKMMICISNCVTRSSTAMLEVWINFVSFF